MAEGVPIKALLFHAKSQRVYAPKTQIRILSNISINKQHRNRSEYEEILFMDHAHDPMGHECETVRGY